jgi:hypothetical protein
VRITRCVEPTRRHLTSSGSLWRYGVNVLAMVWGRLDGCSLSPARVASINMGPVLGCRPCMCMAKFKVSLWGWRHAMSCLFRLPPRATSFLICDSTASPLSQALQETSHHQASLQVANKLCRSRVPSCARPQSCLWKFVDDVRVCLKNAARLILRQSTRDSNIEMLAHQPRCPTVLESPARLKNCGSDGSCAMLLSRGVLVGRLFHQRS